MFLPLLGLATVSYTHLEHMSEFVKSQDVIKKIKEAGFKYVTLDLEGFRSGSMD